MKKLTLTTKFFLAFILILGFPIILTNHGISSPVQAAQTGKSNAQPSQSTPEFGGNITIAESTDPLVLNPLYVVDQVTFDVQQALYCPFFEIVGGKIFYGNGLLKSITSNGDKSVYTLKLKSNLKWHDGKPITADDIVFTINVLVDKNQNVPYQSYGIIDGKAIKAAKVDNLTATITLPKPSAAFLGGLSQIYAIPKHIYENEKNIGKSEKNNNPIGSGPFKFKEFKPGQYVVLERFNDYFDGKPYLDTLTFKVIKDANSANASLLSGDIDARLISSEDYDTINKSGKVVINKYNSGRVNSMSFNTNNDLLKDKNIRLAIAYALNKKELVNFAYLSSDFASPAYSILTPDTLFYKSDLTKHDNDVKKAKSLIAASEKKNIQLKLLYISTNKVMDGEANYIKQKLADVGIEVNLTPLDEATYKNKIKIVNNKDYDLVLHFYTLGEEPDLYRDIASSGSRSNYSHFSDQELDNLWTKGAIEPDNTKRASIYNKIQQIINDRMYIYPIAYSNGFYAVSNKYGGFDKAILKTIYYDYSKIYRK
jgi:peptide/nickel transport system substrate-binding protein